MAQTAQLVIRAMGLLCKLLLHSLTGGGNLESKAWEFSRWASGNISINKYFKQKSACVCRSNNPELKSPCAQCLECAVRFLGAPRHGPDTPVCVSWPRTLQRCCWEAWVEWDTLSPPLILLLKNMQPCSINPTPSGWLFLRN